MSKYVILTRGFKSELSLRDAEERACKLAFGSDAEIVIYKEVKQFKRQVTVHETSMED